jgi:ABC-type dipeptide/oligopeptide/nickel transport system permease subunit
MVTNLETGKKIDFNAAWISVKRFSTTFPAAAVAITILFIITFLAFSAELWTPFPRDKSVSGRLLPLLGDAKGSYYWLGMHVPHLLGTDDIGRDFFTRMLHGGRVSIAVGLVSPTVGIAFGAIFGIIGAYFGGAADLIIQRVTDTLMSIPSIVVSMAITIALGFTLPVVILAIAIGISPYASRLLRSHALTLRGAQYIDAAHAIGASHWRIIFRHIVPNSWAPWIVMLAVNVGNAIVLEASLSYLGIGIAPPTPSWGNLLSRANSFWHGNPHLVIIPGLTITVVVLCANMFGDAIRDKLDPRLRGVGA